MSPLYYTLIVTVGTFVFVYSLVTFVTMSVNWKSYKYYKITYDAIRNCQYVMVSNGLGQQSYMRPDNNNLFSNDEIIFFIERNGEVDSIKLLSRESNYIHSKGGIDLYSRYWFKKIINARDKYNHELHYQRRCDDMVEDVTGNNVYFGNELKPSFKFLRG
jgi:hypothetical protein